MAGTEVDGVGQARAHGRWSIAPPRWVTGYQRGWAPADMIAGLTLWALVVPEAIAFATIAGVPAQFGLYSVPLAVIGYSWFGGSRRLFFGPSSTIAALSAIVVAPLAAAATDAYVLTTAVLSLLVGAIYLVLAAFRMGFMSRLFARPVLDGFIVGLGVFIAVGQLPKLVGVEKPPGNPVNQVTGVLRELGQWHWLTVAMGVGGLVTIVVLEHLAPRIPASLVVVVASVALAAWLSLDQRGVEVVGDIPSGFSLLAWRGISPSDVWARVPGAAAIVVVGFAQSLAIVKAYAAKDHTKVDADRELVAYGVASIGAGVLQGFPPAGSLSKSAANERAGGRSPMAFVVTAVLTVMTIMFLTGFFAELPEATLAAVVIHAVSGMIKPLKIWGLRQIRVPDFWLALFAFLGVILIGVMAGLVIGVLLSLLLLLERMAHPHVAVLGRVPGGFADVAARPDAVTEPGVLVTRIDGPLVFASAEAALDEVRNAILATPTRPELVVLDVGGCYEIDVTAADALAALVDDLRRDGGEIRFAGAHHAVREYAERLSHPGLVGLVEPYATVAAALHDSDQE